MQKFKKMDIDTLPLKSRFNILEWDTMQLNEWKIERESETDVKENESESRRWVNYTQSEIREKKRYLCEHISVLLLLLLFSILLIIQDVLLPRVPHYCCWNSVSMILFMFYVNSTPLSVLTRHIMHMLCVRMSVCVCGCVRVYLSAGERACVHVIHDFFLISQKMCVYVHVLMNASGHRRTLESTFSQINWITHFCERMKWR